MYYFVVPLLCTPYILVLLSLVNIGHKMRHSKFLMAIKCIPSVLILYGKIPTAPSKLSYFENHVGNLKNLITFFHKFYRIRRDICFYQL
jgi:hypothetical protein